MINVYVFICAVWPYKARNECHRKLNFGIRIPNVTFNNSQFTTQMLKVIARSL